MKPAPVLAALLLLGCAKIAPPPGGPVDDIPPEVLATEPADGGTGIAVPYRLAIHFSEKMDRRSVERRLRLFPPARWVRYRWEDGTILLEEEVDSVGSEASSREREVVSLLVESDRTTGETADRGEVVTVTISGFSEDRRGNPINSPHSFSFTSSESLPRGQIGGAVSGAKARAGAPPVTVQAYSIVPGGSYTGEGTRLLIESEAGKEGDFRLAHLPVENDRRILLVVYRDDDENGEIDFDHEYYGYSDTLALSPQSPSLDSIAVRLVSADTPASLSGRVTVPHNPDSTVVYLESLSDSAFFATAEPDSTGHYSFSGLAAGDYRIRLLVGGKTRISIEGAGAAREVLADHRVILQPGATAKDRDLPGSPDEAEESQVTQ